MYKKRSLFAFLFLFLFFISFASAVKPVTSIIATDSGLIIEATTKDYIRTGEDHEFEIHVFNQSDGSYVVSDTNCYMHLYHKNGNHEYEGMDDTVAHDFDYAFDLTGSNFTSRGEYQAKFQCNHSSGIAGGQEIFFWVNDYGEELTEANSSNFNFSMIMLMILFLLAVVGMFVTEHYIGKFALYWIAHVLFVIGSFSMWQFNMGYAMSYVGLAGVWKILFYVSTFAVFPMVITSMAWIFYIHAYNEHFEKVIKNGGNTEEAFRVADAKTGGWKGGK